MKKNDFGLSFKLKFNTCFIHNGGLENKKTGVKDFPTHRNREKFSPTHLAPAIAAHPTLEPKQSQEPNQRKLQSMDPREFQAIGDFLESKSVLLWKHEKSQGINRTFAKTRFDKTKYHKIEISDRRFFVVCTNVFHQMLNSVLAEACQKYPECFGTGSASDVLCALYKIEAVGTIDEFQNFLKEDQFAWVVEMNEGHVQPKLLRIELFRKIDNLKGDQAKTEFTGGAFHSFRHFHYKGVPLSTKKEKKDIDNPSSILKLLILGFFFAELKQNDDIGEKFESKVTFEDNSRFCFAFYLEKHSQIYFVNSARFD